MIPQTTIALVAAAHELSYMNMWKRRQNEICKARPRRNNDEFIEECTRWGINPEKGRALLQLLAPFVFSGYVPSIFDNFEYVYGIAEDDIFELIDALWEELAQQESVKSSLRYVKSIDVQLFHILGGIACRKENSEGGQ
jgi:hypothetical protein